MEVNVVHNENCLDTMRGMPDNSIDSIVTDPPYGLSFMGKKWDYEVPSVEIWKECLRVLKPGGYLLAFAGTRTQHRMCCNIEDAGFEIRDMIAWIYGQGFPKSHNIHKSVEKLVSQPNTHYICIDENRNEWHISNKQEAEHGMRPMPTSNISQTKPIDKEQGKVLQSVLSKQSTYSTMQGEESKESIKDGEESIMEGRSNDVQEEGELCRCEICEMSERIFGDGSEGWVYNGTQTVYGAEDGSVIDKNGSSSSHRPQSSKQRYIKFDAICEQCKTQIIRRYEGLGSAIKPALEPITVARKPLSEKTIALNVLKWGTGGINIDGCRVEINPDIDDKRLGGNGDWSSSKMAKNVYEGGYAGNRVGSSEQGRFPANLIHDGSQMVLDLFPAKAGAAAPVMSGQKGKSNGIYGDFEQKGDDGASFRNDSGSAARFFYCAKASKKDRNSGLDGYRLISYICTWKENNTTKEEAKAQLLVDMEQSHQKGIEEFGTLQKRGTEWSIELFGKFIMAQFLKDCEFTTKTRISSITASEILNYLQHYIINENIQGVSCEMVNGSSLALLVEKPSQLVNTIIERMGFAINVNPALLNGQLEISVNVELGRSNHPTVKPTKLMRYLVRLVTPVGGTVYDPFAGSGSTGKGCKPEGFNFIGSELDEGYCEISNARIK
jgi:DNA modification methylase